MEKSHNKNEKNIRIKKCTNCIHEYACQAWNMGIIHDAESSGCINYEELKDSNAYYLGVRSCEDDAYSRGVLAGIELGKKEALCGITQKESKSMLITIDTFVRLGFNIHEVIDIVDDRNFEKMREILRTVI